MRHTSDARDTVIDGAFEGALEVFLHTLSTETRSLLRVASALPQPFEPRTCVAAMGGAMSDADVVSALGGLPDTLLRAEQDSTGGPLRFAFTNDLFLETCAATLPDAAREVVLGRLRHMLENQPTTAG